MQHYEEFRRFAEGYSRYSLIQERVAAALAKRVGTGFDHIVDLGCGSGAFYKAYKAFGGGFTNYYAVDQASEMLRLHPDAKGVKKIVGDFDDEALYEKLSGLESDIVVSSSALQWSRDLNLALERIASLGKPVAISVFTSGTFASLHDTAGVNSPIRSKEETIEAIRNSLNADITILEYNLYFRDILSMLRYIKGSGVSGGKRMMEYRQIKTILERYSLPYLEFEVVVALSE